MTEKLQWAGEKFMREVEARSGARVSSCLQCHKCSSGCPIGPETDLLSSQAMRMIHLGMEEDLLGSRGIWLCASCQTCSARCPMGIDVAGVMDVLRMMAVERKAALPDKARGRHFHRSFLGSVRRHGRVFELEMMAIYKLRSMDLFRDMDKAPKLMKKSKLPLLPNRSRSAGEVRKVFRNARKEEER